MLRLLIVFNILCNTQLLSQRSSLSYRDQDQVAYYLDLNKKEKRLIEFRDNDEAIKLKVRQLGLINESRRKYKAPPLGLDILASRVANRMCREAAENRYISHWNMAGEKPYHRYAIAGGYDHIAENAFGEWTTGRYDETSAAISELMKKGHASFMSEHAPKDGHKKNVIDKSHNYVGIGFYITSDQFRYYEEFIDRYLEFNNIPAQLKINEEGSISFKTNGACFPYFLSIYREDYPIPMKPDQLNRKGSYSDFTDQKYLDIPAWDISRQKKGEFYRIPLKFSREGLYYIQVFIDRNEIKSPAKLNTKGKTIGSGIVIRVIK